MVYFHKTLYVKKEKSENMVIAIFLPWKIINFIFIPGKLLVRMRECGSRILVTRRELWEDYIMGAMGNLHPLKFFIAAL